ncbi:MULTISPECIES: Hsp70 family protein [Nostoc]|uniref:Hsp70 family protein n=2 Tax=Nostoc TaxID=1177 RepID=A0ABR8IJQ0_9NOSO|nr:MULTISPECIES: Hsp70 family protein [Nostoc]MBD2565129.1 Hsp70 family protein [Nostoc linckia FACHB-391]MBD2650730.1 Hsp70 family protein [Nostoc foliaceum FACHB-393]
MVGFGIDFGTTNSVAAAFNGEELTSFVDKEGLPHPSIVWYRGDSQPIVGRNAKDQIKDFQNTPGNKIIRSIKSQIQQEEEFEIFGKSKYTWQVASEIFRFLKEDVKTRYANFPAIEEAVVTVPLYFNGRQRRAIRKAAEMAGVTIKTFIHEPFAAVVGYLLADSEQWENLKQRRENILVFDWGGGTLDITLVKLDSGCLYEVSTAGANGKSGDYLDEVLMNYVIDTFQREKSISSEGFRIEPGIESLLLHEVEFSKIDLSIKHNSSIELFDFYSDNERSYNLFQDINRSQFECLIQLQIQDAMALVDKILHDTRLQPSQINQVLLIGGTSRIPLLINEMHKTFGLTKVIELPNADTVIAEGAAIISYYDWQPYLVQPIDVQLADQNHYTVFESGTILKPDTAKKEVAFFCTDNREGEGRLIITTNLDNREHQVKEIINVPISKVLQNIYKERIIADFRIDRDVILRVSAKGSVKDKPVYTDIHDLCYGLRFA